MDLSLWNPVYRDFWPLPDDLYVACLLDFYRTLLCLGYVDQARLRRDEALAEARRRSPFTLVFALCHSWFGDWGIEGVTSAQKMLRSAEEALTIAREHKFYLYLGVANIMRGWCLAALGKTAEGMPLVVQTIARGRAMGAILVFPFLLTVLAEVHALAGEPGEGLDRLAEAAKMVETTRECWAEAEMHRLRGTLLLSMNRHAQAENSYRQALAVAQRQSAKLWELRAATSLARLWRDQGKRTEAHDLLAPVYGWFTEGFDTPVLKEAKALLGELAA
jgi:predicted ATPase